MRILTLIALLFVFTIGGLTDIAHASVPDGTCVHQQIDQGDSINNELCHSDQDQSHDDNTCDDCCCVHSHLMVNFITLAETALDISEKNSLEPDTDFYSAVVSSLKRPPRL